MIAAIYDLEIHHMDVCTAFLGVDLEEEIYMHPLQRYVHLLQNGNPFNDPRLTKTSPKMVLRLRKSLYGLKQSSDVWYRTVKNFVMLIWFVALLVDGGLFVLEDQSTDVTAVVLYVDDLLNTANEGLIGQIKDQMKTRFWMHVLGSVCFYRGLNIERNREHDTIDIHQHSYIRTILAKFRLEESRPIATPMAMKLHKRKPDNEACNPTIYQLTIGSLIYAMTATHPDIEYGIRVLSWNNHVPSNEPMVALKRVFRYSNGTKDWRLRVGGALGGVLAESTLGGEGEGALICYVVSDYAWCPDDYKSTCGLVITFGGAVNWRSRKEMSTAHSMTNAEYCAFGVRCMRLTPMLYLLNKLCIPTAPHVFSDSQSLIVSIKNKICCGTAVAHVATKNYLASDISRDGEIGLSHILTAEMIADCFTEPLPKPAFLKSCAEMGMIGIGLGNGLGNGLGIGIRHGVGNALGIPGNAHRNDTGTGNGIGNAVGK